MSSTKPNNNYFLPYLKYKLKENRIAAVIFAILNFLALIVPCVILLSAIDFKKKHGEPIIFFDPESSSITLMLIFSAVVMIMLLIVSARAFKYYYNRAMMDTLGCLPLSYKDRFWGDYFGGLLANMISFVPLAFVSFFLTIFINSGMKELSEETSNLSERLRKIIISLFIIYIGVHAVTVFMTSCCGRLRTSILFSAVLMLGIPGIYVVYGLVGYSDLVGIDPLEILTARVGVLAPLGEVFSQVLKIINEDYSIFNEWDGKTAEFAIDSAFKLIIMILVIAAFIAGAYFIGKRRKAERVEQGFVFNMSLYVVTIVISVLVIGFALYYFPRGYEIDKISVIKAAVMSFVLFMGLELSQKKSFKGIAGSLIRYVLVFGASFGVLTLMRSTRGFGEESRVPSVSSVSKVIIDGEYFYGNNRSDKWRATYKEKSSVSTITDVHKNILEHKNEFTTGDMLEITYRMNDGSEFTRHYSCSEENAELIKGFSTEIKNVEEEGINFGFLSDPVYEGVNILSDPSNSGINIIADRTKGDVYILPEKFGEFMEILKNDVKYNYHANWRNSYGVASFRKSNTGNDRNSYIDSYTIMKEYEATIAFIENPENVIDAEKFLENAEKRYKVTYNGGGVYSFDIDISVKSTDESAAVQKLIGLMVPRDYNEVDSGIYCNKIFIYDYTTRSSFSIKAEDEEEAVKAIIEVFRGQVLQ